MSTNGVKFLTHEVGSLAKPPWLVKTSAGKPLQDSDIEHARKWGEKVGVEDYQQLIELLEADERDPDEVARWSSRYCMRLQESAGVDWIWDGEQQRSEMYAWAVAHANGFEERGTVRSFDNKYYTKSAVVDTPSLRAPYHNDELEFLASAAEHDLKIPVTGAYTLAVWSYDERYGSRDGRLGRTGRRADSRRRRGLTPLSHSRQ